MQLDISIHKGHSSKPAIIFIHGLGMDKNFWLDPLETRVLAKNIPMKVFGARRPAAVSLIPDSKVKKKARRGLTIGDVPGKITNLWYALRDKGYNLVCWSQRRPVGPIGSAIEELGEVLVMTERVFPGRPVVLVCHSRGGLVARKFMEKSPVKIKALVTVSTPHLGSSLSRLGAHLSPLSAFLKGVLPRDTHGTLSDVVRRVNDLIEGTALRELIPGSRFITDLKDVPLKGVTYLSFGGKKTELINFYKWKQKGDVVLPIPVLSIPDSLIKLLPSSIVPDEIIAGKGDFMVTTVSAVLPWAERHFTVHANHISITWNRKVVRTVIDALGRL